MFKNLTIPNHFASSECAFNMQWIIRGYLESQIGNRN